MTVGTYTPIAYATNGSTVDFNFAFEVFDTSEVVVLLRTDADGSSSTLTETTEYSVVLQGSGPAVGGTVTTVATYDAGFTLLISRATSQKQTTDLTESGILPANDVEAQFDKLEMQTQEQQAQGDRSLRYPLSDSSLLTSILPNSIDRASKVAAFDSGGNATAISAVPEGSVAFSAFGEELVEAANAAAAKVILNLDAAEDVRDFGAIGDGVADDTVAIQAAIDALTSGGIVIFPVGTYKTTALITILDNVTLLGTKGAVIRPNGEDISWFQNADTSGGNSGISIIGLEIDGSSMTDASVATAALSFITVTDLIIRDCTISNVPVHAIVMSGVTTFEVSHNFISVTGTAEFKASPPVESGQGISSANLQNGVIVANNIFDCWGASILIFATSGNKTRNLTIANNLIDTSDDNGIRVSSGNADNIEDVSNITITGNTIIDVDGSGIRANGAYISVTGNTIELQDLIESDADATHAPHGINVWGVHITVTGNTINDGTGIMTAGIKVSTSGDDIGHIILSSNVIDNVGDGQGIIVFRALETETMADIIITDNIITNTTTQEGIHIQDVERLVIRGNIIRLSFQEGVYVEDSSQIVASGNIMHNNNQQGLGYRGGFRFFDCTDLLISNNRCYDDQDTKTQKWGVHLDGTTNHVLVIGNDLRGNALGGLGSFLPGPTVGRGDDVIAINNRGDNTDVTVSCENASVFYEGEIVRLGEF